MRIAVVSGKGGAGKTNVAVSLALVASSALVVDCDVEEPNVSLLLKPVILGRVTAFRPTPKINTEACDFCGLCAEVCRFNAIMVLPKTVLVFEKMCKSCGVCSFVCPRKAVHEVQRPIGEIEWGRAGSILYVGGKLNVGEAMPTPLVSQVKKKAEEFEVEITIFDAPPGITCPVVEVLESADYILIVAESTAFGKSDLEIVLEFVENIKTPFGVLENKAGLSRRFLIRELCERRNIPYLGAIPFSEDAARACAEGVPLIEAVEGGWDLFADILSAVRG